MPSLPPSSFSRGEVQTDRGRPVAAIHTTKERNAPPEATPNRRGGRAGVPCALHRPTFTFGGSAHISAWPVTNSAPQHTPAGGTNALMSLDDAAHSDTRPRTAHAPVGLGWDGGRGGLSLDMGGDERAGGSRARRRRRGVGGHARVMHETRAVDGDVESTGRRLPWGALVPKSTGFESGKQRTNRHAPARCRACWVLALAVRGLTWFNIPVTHHPTALPTRIHRTAGHCRRD